MHIVISSLSSVALHTRMVSWTFLTLICGSCCYLLAKSHHSLCTIAHDYRLSVCHLIELTNICQALFFLRVVLSKADRQNFFGNYIDVKSRWVAFDFEQINHVAIWLHENIQRFICRAVEDKPEADVGEVGEKKKKKKKKIATEDLVSVTSFICHRVCHLLSLRRHFNWQSNLQHKQWNLCSGAYDFNCRQYFDT